MLKFKNKRVILGSQSPRRSQLLQEMGIDFEVIVRETDEIVDADLSPLEAVKLISRKKAEAFLADFQDDLIITADTIVVTLDQEILGKPKDATEAFEVLKKLSTKTHHVITAVTILNEGDFISFAETTEVEFFELADDEIQYYVDRFSPLDKAGSYGIQEWIGRIGIKSIHGEYSNVVGLPTARLYQELKGIK